LTLHTLTKGASSRELALFCDAVFLPSYVKELLTVIIPVDCA